VHDLDGGVFVVSQDLAPTLEVGVVAQPHTDAAGLPGRVAQRLALLAGEQLGKLADRLVDSIGGGVQRGAARVLVGAPRGEGARGGGDGAFEVLRRALGRGGERLAGRRVDDVEGARPRDGVVPIVIGRSCVRCITSS
jgi:hypothetical protein